HRRIGGLQHRSRFGDGDRFAHVADFQAHVDLEIVIHAEDDVVPGSTLEPVALRGDGVSPGNQQRGRVRALIVGGQAYRYAGFDVGDHHARAGDSGIVRVDDAAGDGST